MSLIETLESLGNTTPSLSLIVSLIVGASIITTSVICKKSSAQTNDNNIDCNTLLYLGGSIIVSGIVLFYFAQDNNLALYEGLSIISSVVISCYVLYKINN